MLIITLNWVYIFITCFITGHAILSALSLVFGEKIKWGLLHIELSGFAFVTAYAGYFSLFHGVGAAANVVLILICLLLLFFERAYYIKKAGALPGFLGIRLRSCTASPLRLLWLIPFILIFLFILILSCYGSFHSDSGLYHAQSIRWIEEYGVIRGLGLLQNRFGYNSAFFSVSALYSFAFLGQSLHGVNGYMAELVSLYAFYGIKKSLFDRSFGRLSNFAELAPLFYMVLGGIELISPTTDPILLYLFFAIVILWIREAEGDDRTIVYTLLCIITVFLVSVKLSVGVLVLLVIQPAVSLIREKRVKEIIVSISSGVILLLPYFIRNVLISGYLIYPFPGIDLFDLPWKIPYESARHDADEITTWARYVRDASRIDEKVWEWAPSWWQGQTVHDRCFSLVFIIGAVAGLVWCIISLIRQILSREKRRLTVRMLFLESVLIAGSLFWFLSAPLIRYGYLYLLLLPLLTAGCIYNSGRTAGTAGRILSCIIPALLIVMMLLPIGSIFYKDIVYMENNRSCQYAVFQKDYPVSPVKSREYCGSVFYFPEEPGTPVWYAAFPSVLYEENLDYIEPMGDTIKDGFRIREQNAALQRGH
ncbi:MAG: hypothetical protein IJU87_04230 [Lachnospiraceae bacterium]|nr:hypothetical protein [Lachnospiraceae bacterium]